ncbi:hypothetical protein XM38_027180 [Halomicronema hongdechloris C2206]|uniref:Metal-binding protein n=1 Tax=Halomicronema hongdechloris C2206 TaxID=1641165 RepID=A0A1Z3HN68_9CYAN|nr:DUF1636 domain-containing protein [Halomicronema hongdechloris]ASC71764.1 hypothetical protein XM38_027180 [Halomicronema hongdechloris C2206]
MSKHILFICKSCNAKSEQEHTSDPSDGTKLLNQLQILHQTWPHQADLEIREVGCLWTCSSPCAVAFSAPDKATYLFTQVPATESAKALLKFGEHYLASNDGTIPWKHFPEALQSASIAKIPSV